MAKFRKKPIVIEAFEVLPGCYCANFPKWFCDALTEGKAIISPDEKRMSTVITILTLEGSMDAYPRDFIIQGIKGEIYPCKHDIFEATYEAVV